MPKLDLAAIPEDGTTGYLPPYHLAVAGRRYRRLTAGLTDFGANLTTLPPGVMSSMRHWHSDEDELVFVVSGEAALIDDGGETVMRAGDVATFAKGVPDGHQFANRGAVDVVLLSIGGSSEADRCTYPDADMFWSMATGYVRASALGA